MPQPHSPSSRTRGVEVAEALAVWTAAVTGSELFLSLFPCLVLSLFLVTSLSAALVRAPCRWADSAETDSGACGQFYPQRNEPLGLLWEQRCQQPPYLHALQPLLPHPSCFLLHAGSWEMEAEWM